MSDMFGAAIPLGIWAAFVIIDRFNPWTTREAGFWACWYAVLGIWAMVDGDRPMTMTARGGFSAWLAYKAWKRRKPRQRKPSKALGMVRDLGHRLVVTSS
jgi:hypothetical protein